MMLNLQTSTTSDHFPDTNYNVHNDGKLKERILIVDDEKVIRKFICECLSPRYHCVEAASAEEALEILEEKRFALVITDWVMTGNSGTTLLRYIVRELPDTPVIMVTGVNHPERALDAMRFGAFDYLLKPCKPDTLDFTVERALKHRDLEIKNRQYKIDLELQNIELIKQKKELENLQARMIHTEKMASLGQLAAGIAHEINNPLGFVGGNLYLLEDYLHDIHTLLDSFDQLDIPDHQLENIEKLKEKIGYKESKISFGQTIDDCNDGLDRIKKLVENLRVFSKIDEPSFTKTDLNKDIKSTIKLLNHFFEKQGIKLKTIYGEIPEIDAFAGHLNQVWMNILINAVQAIETDGGEISVSTKKKGDFVIVEILDTGEGISQENISRIFDPFFTTRSIGCGVGLGLSTTHSIVEEHSGSIKVESELGYGTTFRVKLPIIQTIKRITTV